MRVQEVSRVGVWAPHSRFRYVSSPFYIHTDYPWIHGAQMWDANDYVTCDYDLEAVYPAPVRMPCHLKLITAGESWSTRYEQAYSVITTPNRGIAIADPALPQLDWEVLGDKPTGALTTSFHMVDSNYNGTGLPLYDRDPDQVYIDYQPIHFVERDGCVWLQGEQQTYGDRVINNHFAASNLSLQGATFFQNIDHTPERRDDVVGPEWFGILVDGILQTVYGYRRTSLQTDNTQAQWYANRVTIGSGADAVQYQVRFDGRGEALIQKRNGTEGAWSTITSVPPAASLGTASSFVGTTSQNTASAGFSFRMISVEFRLLCGRLSVRIGTNETPYYFEEARVGVDGKLIDRITRLEWEAERLLFFMLAVYPTRWRKTPYLDSPEIMTGFRSGRVGKPVVHYAQPKPFGWTATIDVDHSELEGPSASYRLKFQGPDDVVFQGQSYSNTTCPVRAVDLIWLPIEDYRPARASIVEPIEIEVSHTFDAGTLQIGSEACLTFNDNKPVDLPTGEFAYWGEWAVATGQVATEIQLGRNVPPNFFGVEGVNGNTVFAGYGNTAAIIEGGAGVGWNYKMMCGDRRRQLMTDRWALPWMDNWHAHYSQAFLAQLGGVSTSEMSFIDWVPQTPFGPGTDLGTPEGQPAYYLPAGEQGSVLTRNSGVALWTVMSRIAWAMGYMLYFDLFGRLAFHKFFRPRGVKRNFYESDVESAAQPGGGMEGCWNVRVGKDMGAVRSDAIVVGVNAFGPIFQPIVYKQSDDGVVYDDLAFNHLGYRNPAAVIDSLYGQDSFAYRASVALITFLRLPDLSATFTSWLQPDIFPMDIVRLQSRRAGMMDIPLMVTGVQHHANLAGASTTIRGQFVPEQLF